MAIKIRRKNEIEKMRKAGMVVKQALDKIEENCKAGVNTAELDKIACDVAAEYGAETLFKGVRSPYTVIPFPGAICASVNEQVVHGIPSKGAVLKEGDIFSVDFGVRLDGYCGDSARTIAVGDISGAKKRLMSITLKMLELAIENIAPGKRWSEIAGIMQQTAEDAGYSVVRDLVGHGIGTQMHEEPQVPNFVSRYLLKNDIVLKEGMVLAVEPMVNMGRSSVKTLRDGWTVVTRDASPSAHFEHTIAVSGSGSDVLTA
ncbi:MAG: type I methionyl aminopeptidase [Sedimentisphaeraceae bacterium JB056]